MKNLPEPNRGPQRAAGRDDHQRRVECGDGVINALTLERNGGSCSGSRSHIPQPDPLHARVHAHLERNPS